MANQKEMEGRAVGQMFAGLTLANVLGVPAGAWIGNQFGWHVTFIVVAILGAVATIAIAVFVPHQGKEAPRSLSSQIGAFKNPQLLASLTITMLGWVGFMTFYGYIAPIAEQVAGFDRSALTWILVVVGLGLVLGNSLGGKSADKDLSKSLILWPAAMIIALIAVGFLAPYQWPFIIAAFVIALTHYLPINNPDVLNDLEMPTPIPTGRGVLIGDRYTHRELDSITRNIERLHWLWLPVTCQMPVT